MLLAEILSDEVQQKLNVTQEMHTHATVENVNVWLKVHGSWPSVNQPFAPV